MYLGREDLVHILITRISHAVLTKSSEPPSRVFDSGFSGLLRGVRDEPGELKTR